MPFCFSCFWDRIFHFCLGPASDCDSPTYASCAVLYLQSSCFLLPSSRRGHGVSGLAFSQSTRTRTSAATGAQTQSGKTARVASQPPASPASQKFHLGAQPHAKHSGAVCGLLPVAVTIQTFTSPAHIPMLSLNLFVFQVLLAADLY
jgi:hypothetical protein